MKRILTAAVLLMASAAYAQDTVTDTLGFTTSASGNVAELLRGQISNVRVSSIDGNPVGGVNLNIRGINSLRSDNQPLWIIDGIMLSTDLNQNLDAFWQYDEQSYTAPLNPLAFLNANEIESIEVLKDVAATSVYGTLGANGVVIVKTKMPSKGERSFSWNSDFGYNGGFNTNHHAALQGTTDKTAYNISMSYRHIGSALARNYSDYGLVKANFQTKANKVVWFGLNALLGLGLSESPSGVAYFGRPSMTLAMRDPLLSPSTTPQIWAADYDDKTNDYRALIGGWLRFNFGNFVYMKFNVGLDLQNNARNIWYGKRTEFGQPSATNLFGGAAANLVSFLTNYTASGEVNFNKYFAVHHHLSAKLYAEYIGNSNKFNTLNGINFASDELRGNGLRYGAYNIELHKFIRQYNHIGGYLNLAYNFKGIINVNAVCRVDYSPKYLDKEINIYPSGSMMIDLHKAFMPANKTVSTLQVKGSYGISGLEKYIPYELFGNYLSSTWYEPEKGTSTFYDGLDKLRTTEWTASVELGFLSDRIRFTGTFYDRSTDDIFVMYRMGSLLEDAVDNYWVWGGCDKVFERKSVIRNQGVEFDLSAEIIRSRDWTWTLGANVAYNTNAVMSSNPEDFNGRVVGNNVYCTCNSLGLPVSSLYGYMSDRNGNYIDITGEGRIDMADKVVLGNTIPVYYGGLQTTLRWKDLSLNVMVDGAGGHNVANVNALVKDGVVDSEGYICLSTKYIERADWLRLSQVGLRYDVPLKSKVIKGLSVRLSGHNLLTLTPYSGWNPDVNCFGVSALTGGIDYGSYPLMRMYILGFNIKF